MSYFRYCLFLLFIISFCVLSCSSDNVYGYETNENDPCATREYRLNNGIRVFLTKNTAQPRVAAAVCIPVAVNDTVDEDCRAFALAENRRFFMTQIGARENLSDVKNGTFVSIDDIPSCELENWSYFTNSFFRSLPSNTFIVISGDISFDETVSLLDNAFGEKDICRFEQGKSDMPVSSFFCFDDEKSESLIWKKECSIEKSSDYLSLISDILKNEGHVGLLDSDLSFRVFHGKQGDFVSFVIENTADGFTGSQLNLVAKSVDKVMKGDFSNELLEAVKLNASVVFECRKTKNIFRVTDIVDAVSAGLPSNDVFARIERFKSIKKEDISAFAVDFFGKGFEKIIVTPDASMSIAKHCISSTLLPSTVSGKIVFPDYECVETGEMENRHYVACADKVKGQFFLSLRFSMPELPEPFLAFLADYYNELNTYATLGYLYGLACRSCVKASDSVLEFTLCGTEKNSFDAFNKIFTCWDSLSDTRLFMKYVYDNRERLSACKRNVPNIAVQAHRYLKGGRTLFGAADMANFCFDMFSYGDCEFVYSGDKNNLGRLVSLVAEYAGSKKTKDIGKNKNTEPFDSVVGTCFIPADIGKTSLFFVPEYDCDVREKGMMLLFNKASELYYGESSLFRYSDSGVFFCDTVCNAAVFNGLPFSKECFRTAKSYLLYECSTNNLSGCDLLEDFVSSSAISAKESFCSILYDELVDLEYSDVCDFHASRKNNVRSVFIVGKQSEAEQYRFISNDGNLVHLTFDELFGY